MTSSILHSEQTTVDGIHIPYAFLYQTLEERESATGFSQSDIGKIARQTSPDESLWMLVMHQPPRWQRVSYDANHLHNLPELVTTYTAGSNVTFEQTSGSTVSVSAVDSYQKVQVDGAAELVVKEDSTLRLLSGANINLTPSIQDNSIVVAVDGVPAHGATHATTDPIPDVLTQEQFDSFNIAPGAEVNQNAFSFVASPGATTIGAGGKTATLNIVGAGGTTITTNAATSTLTITSSATSGGTTGYVAHHTRHEVGGDDAIQGLLSTQQINKLSGIEDGAQRNVINSVLGTGAIQVSAPDSSGMVRVSTTMASTQVAAASGSGISLVSSSSTPSNVLLKRFSTVGTGISVTESNDVITITNTGGGSGTLSTHAASHYLTGTDAIPLATTSQCGLMSPSDKDLLNTIQRGANVSPSLVEGTGIVLARDVVANTVTISAAAVAGEVNTASNAALDSTTIKGLFKGKSGVDLQLRSLMQGNNITLAYSADGNSVRIDALDLVAAHKSASDDHTQYLHKDIAKTINAKQTFRGSMEILNVLDTEPALKVVVNPGASPAAALQVYSQSDTPNATGVARFGLHVMHKGSGAAIAVVPQSDGIAGIQSTVGSTATDTTFCALFKNERTNSSASLVQIINQGMASAMRVTQANTLATSPIIDIANSSTGAGIAMTGAWGASNAKGIICNYHTRGNNIVPIFVDIMSPGGKGVHVDQWDSGWGFYTTLHYARGSDSNLSNGVGVATVSPDQYGLQITGPGKLATGGNAEIGGALTVAGAKSAIVETSQGKTLLYAEESTEVWFADYGFGQADSGEIKFKPLFAETVDLSQPYHVFVQAYEDGGRLSVTRCNAAGFTVVTKEGATGGKFSYRIVAKRKGYADKRLERMV